MRGRSWILCFGASLLPVAMTVTWAVMLNAAPLPPRGAAAVVLARMRVAQPPRAPSEVRIARVEPSLVPPTSAETVLARVHAEPETALPDSAPPDSVEASVDEAEPLEPFPAPESAVIEPAMIDPCEQDEPPPRMARELFYGRDDRKVAMLTFDDGPHARNTPRILEILREHDVKATFFVLGHRAVKRPDLVARIAEGGHDVGNHSWSHPSFRSLWKSQIEDEVCRTSAVITDATGRRPSLMRPPYGRYAPSAVPLLGSLGFDLVLWSVDSHDWETNDPDVLAREVVRAAKPGSIILMHDDEPSTVAALPLVIDGLRRRGFALEPVSAVWAERAL